MPAVSVQAKNRTFGRHWRSASVEVGMRSTNSLNRNNYPLFDNSLHANQSGRLRDRNQLPMRACSPGLISHGRYAANASPPSFLSGGQENELAALATLAASLADLSTTFLERSGEFFRPLGRGMNVAVSSCYHARNRPRRWPALSLSSPSSHNETCRGASRRAPRRRAQQNRAP